MNKKPWLAATLNVIPGLGYFYLRKKVLFGALVLTGLVISTVATFSDPLLVEWVNAEFNTWSYVGAFGELLILAGFMYDAYKEAKS